MNNQEFKLVGTTRVLICLIVGVLGMSARSPVALSEELKPSISDITISPVQQAQLLQTGEIEQVTSVSQLSDVQPTDWAFQALQSLVDRYGCIAGYPDSS